LTQNSNGLFPELETNNVFVSAYFSFIYLYYYCLGDFLHSLLSLITVVSGLANHG